MNDDSYEPLFITGPQAYEMAIKDFLNPVPSILFSEKYSVFNQYTGGFRMKEFTILCGASGIGKTTLLANWSAELVKKKQPHFVLSVETGYTDFARRVICAISDININGGDKIDKDRIDSIEKACKGYFYNYCLNISLYENRVKVEDLIKNLRYMREEYDCKIAFIDNLNFFMEVTSAQNSVIEMDRVIHELIIFCKQCDIHLVMVMHPKKTTSTRVESEFDIKGSSTAVQEAHNIFLFNRVIDDEVETINKYSRSPIPIIDINGRKLKIQKMRRKGENTGKAIFYTGSPVSYQEVKINV